MGRHTCHAIGCDKPTRPAMFMCFDHWKRVPKGVQEQIWGHYRNGQEDDKRITRAYAETAKVALRIVADKEGVSYTEDDEALVLYDVYPPVESGDE